MIEKKLHFKLSFREKMQLKIHKMMCDACTNYEVQSTLIEKSIEQAEIKTIKVDIEKLKKQITEKLTDAGA